MTDRQPNKLKRCNIERFIDDEEDTSFRWQIYSKQNKHIGEFEFCRDSLDRVWLNGCGVEIQGQGIGSNIIQHAVRVFGAVFFCTTPKEELIGGGNGYDSRYLTEEGVKFMNSCLRKKIIKPEWAIGCKGT